MAVRVQVPLRVRAEADRLRFVFFCFYTPYTNPTKPVDIGLVGFLSLFCMGIYNLEELNEENSYAEDNHGPAKAGGEHGAEEIFDL